MNKKQVRENKYKVLESSKACSTRENIYYILGGLLEGHKVFYTENLAKYKKGIEHKIKTAYFMDNSEHYYTCESKGKGKVNDSCINTVC